MDKFAGLEDVASSAIRQPSVNDLALWHVVVKVSCYSPFAVTVWIIITSSVAMNFLYSLDCS